MAFDDATRGRLRDFVGDARTLLTTEFTNQFQQEYGLDPESGDVAALDALKLDDQRLETARILRQIFDHYLASAIGHSAEVRKSVLARMVREQAFTTLNRLAALRMMEARGLVMECVAKGYQSKAFQLYQRVAGSALGETGDAYRVFLLSLCDLYSADLPTLFDRHYPNGRLFPREPALLPLLNLVNATDIAPLWGEDETIGWIYQYFNSQEERKAMREASSAPRNSRELAVRNQFFTPRYVVEFLVENTLGRLWFNWTAGQTGLRDRCQYLLVKPDEQPEPAQRLRDPRTIKLLDPACGSMHFGLYAFDLFLDIYREAWAWEHTHGAGCLDTETSSTPGLKPLCLTYADEIEFLRDVPRLVIEQNIYGVDIDPRAAQIASLALWLRAQRAWHEAGVKAQDRPMVGRGHVVAAVAPPAELELRKGFMTNLDQLDAALFEKTLFLLKGLPELGVLLQVEKELPKLIRSVFGEHGVLFKSEDMAQWQNAEVRLREALTEFANAARSSYQGRLFAHDALQGLRIIDLDRIKFDAVVMNPPFGALSNGSKVTLEEGYPLSSNDHLSVFVERGLNLLRRGGRLGAITSRTCFFLSSFKDWRKAIVLQQSAVDVIADLGQGVMDDAMVEAAAYVLARGENNPKVTVIRAIAEPNRIEAVDQCMRAYRGGYEDARLFNAETRSFEFLPDLPFVYWVSAENIKQFASDRKFDPDNAKVCQGISTSDNFRFVRAVWEVPYRDTIFCYYPTDGTDYCRLDDPIVRQYLMRRDLGCPNWAFHVMSGPSQPWFSPITVKVQFADNGAQLRNFKDKNGKAKGVLRNPTYYHRPGISWTRRAVRFYPYAVPGNCIASASRYMAFPDHGTHFEVLAVTASRMVSAFLRFYAEFWQRPNYLVDSVKGLPWPRLSVSTIEFFEKLVTKEVETRRKAYQNFEPFHEFVVPLKVRDLCEGGKALAFDPYALIGEQGEHLVAEGYGFVEGEAEAVERDLREAIAYQRRAQPEGKGEEGQDDAEGQDFVLDTSAYAVEEAHISYLLGCAFGRWDVGFATGKHEPPPLGDPFAPLTVCPPGMLKNDRGLPAESHELPPSYPLEASLPSIFVDDEGHQHDIVEHIRRVLAIIWKDDAENIEEEACRILGTRSLREYMRKSSGFFADHLKRYTKSSRRAPIYWPIATASGNYTLWIYYPRLTNQTLYTALNDFIEPKLRQLSGDVTTLRSKGGVSRSEDERRLEALQALEQELLELRNCILEIAPIYEPNHGDGVQICAAPLWSLFRLRPWQKILRDTWVRLEAGDYDWAHMAMAYWPDRVRQYCKTDKSLAIAHGLQELYEPLPASTTGPSRGGRKRRGAAL